MWCIDAYFYMNTNIKNIVYWAIPFFIYTGGGRTSPGGIDPKIKKFPGGYKKK